MKYLLIVLFLATPAYGEYAHRSNPGDPTKTGSAITATTPCPGAGCLTVNAEGADTLFITIAGTWNATLNFVGSNDRWATNKALLAYPYNTSTGVITTGVTSTTANGDWQVASNGFREVGILATVFTSNASMTVRIDADPSSMMEVVSPTPGAVFSTIAVQTATTGAQIACNSGVSPCTVTNSAATVLNANTSRKSCFLQAMDVVDLYCKRNTSGGSAASATNMDFLLNAGSATKKAGGSYACDSPGGVWTGAINCIASGASAVPSLNVVETQ